MTKGVKVAFKKPDECVTGGVDEHATGRGVCQGGTGMVLVNQNHVMIRKLVRGRIVGMTKQMLKWAGVMVALVTTLMLTGCQEESVSSSKLSAGVAKVAIKEGETTQADVLRLFGAPNLVTRSSEGEEVWNYNRMSFDNSSSGFGFLVGSKAVSSSASRSIDVIIVFNKADVVKSYKVIQASY